MTTLKKWSNPRTGEVRRVYVERSGLGGKLWLEPGAGSIEVRHYGNEADFSSQRSGPEPPHVLAAKVALGELGLDLSRCSWEEIVAKAVAN
jgi:hypothetical protein